MPTFSDPFADAHEAREAVRRPAPTTLSIEEPSSIYPVLGAVSSALASLSQSLHQLAEYVHRAHEIEATSSHHIWHHRSLLLVQRPSHEPGLSW